MTNATGNTLNVYAKGLTVQSVQNFEFWNFILPANIQPRETMLTVIQAVDMTAGVKVTPRGGVAMAGGGNLLKKGDRATLIHSDNGVTSGGYDGQQTTGTAFQGVSVEYKFKVESDAKNLYAVVTAPDTPTPGPNPPKPPPAKPGAAPAAAAAAAASAVSSPAPAAISTKVPETGRRNESCRRIRTAQ